METIRDKISKNDSKPSNIESGKVEKYIYGKLEGQFFNYFYKNGDDIKYVNDTINTQHDTDGTGDTGVPIQTGQFYNYVMDNFGKNPTDYNGINYAGILVEPGGVDGFTHIPPLASFYTSRGLNNTQDHRGWTDVLNSDRRMTCGSVIDFLHSLKHLTSPTGDIDIDIQTKYDDIRENICTRKKYLLMIIF